MGNNEGRPAFPEVLKALLAAALQSLYQYLKLLRLESNIFGSASNARAKEINWRCPADNVLPRSSTTVW